MSETSGDSIKLVAKISGRKLDNFGSKDTITIRTEDADTTEIGVEISWPTREEFSLITEDFSNLRDGLLLLIEEIAGDSCPTSTLTSEV